MGGAGGGSACGATATAPTAARSRTSACINPEHLACQPLNTLCLLPSNPGQPHLPPAQFHQHLVPSCSPPLVPPLPPLWSGAGSPSACPHLQVAALHRHTHRAARQLSLQRQHAGGLHDGAHTSQAAMQHRAPQRLAVRSCNVWQQGKGHVKAQISTRSRKSSLHLRSNTPPGRRAQASPSTYPITCPAPTSYTNHILQRILQPAHDGPMLWTPSSHPTT